MCIFLVYLLVSAVYLSVYLLCIFLVYLCVYRLGSPTPAILYTVKGAHTLPQDWLLPTPVQPMPQENKNLCFAKSHHYNQSLLI